MLFWFKFYRKHSRSPEFVKVSYAMLGVDSVHAECKCGWHSEDHGVTARGHDSALEEFMAHLQTEKEGLQAAHHLRRMVYRK